MKLPKNMRYQRILLAFGISAIILISVMVITTEIGNAAFFSESLNKPEFSSQKEVEHGLAFTESVSSTIFLPVTSKNYPWISPFGFESYQSYIADGSVFLDRAVDLDANWVRMNARISWRELQPVDGGPIDWSSLAGFENELVTLKEKGFTPIVIIDDHPYWAVKPFTRGGELVYSSCAAIKPAKLESFRSFVRKVVERYSSPEYGVHHWEFGNEPDIDPTLVKIDNIFGCWGDIDDPYYGGEYYGEMLKVVTPAIKSVDPGAKVWIGGLLLDNPHTTAPNRGRPELFLQGILEAKAEPYFDIVGYHVYTGYIGERIDYDMGEVWVPWGGNTRGKARFLRSIMDQYGVNKPVFLNETGLMCPDHVPYDVYCLPPDDKFYQAQADHVVRTFSRGLSEGIMGFTWYTLEGHGWRFTGLLDDDGEPKLVFLAYQQLIARLDKSEFVEKIYYGSDIEAYAFEAGTHKTHVVWMKENIKSNILIPASSLIEVYDQYGMVLPKTQVGTNYQIEVGFSPIYLLLDL